MLDKSITDRVRLIVADIHSRAEMISVYGVAANIPVMNGGHDMKALTDFIAEEAIRVRAAVCWDDGKMAQCSEENGDPSRGDGRTLQ